MRKVLPRLFNILSFVIATFIILPFPLMSQFFGSLVKNPVESLTFFEKVWSALATFFYNFEYLQIAIIPVGLAAIGLLFFIISMIDYWAHKKETTLALMNAAINPVAYVGIYAAILGIFVTFFAPYNTAMHFNTWDYYGLLNLGGIGTWINNHILDHNAANLIVAVAFYVALLLTLVSFTFFRRRLQYKNTFVRFLEFLFINLVSFLALKGVFDYVSMFRAEGAVQTYAQYVANGGHVFTFFELFGFGGTTQQLLGFQSQVFTGNFLPFIPYIVAGLGLLIFIVIGIVDMSIDRNATARSKGKKKVEPRRDYKAPVEEQGNKPVEEFKPNIEEQPQEDEELFVVPKPEEELVTEVEEKTIIRQVVYEKSDLNEVFGTDFEFRNCSMVRREGFNEYFVNKQKFLTLTNSKKSISFRLELDKAIRLIIQYPLVGKDKYENHKIWFKIDDISILNKDIIIQIIKDAYTTVLQNQ
ncbi:MAG: hypothetical protein K6F59_04795 [Gammaproteobacteria bacterium]|nr:hypothetical protein [Gammaproteobacteria bacterium]